MKALQTVQILVQTVPCRKTNILGKVFVLIGFNLTYWSHSYPLYRLHGQVDLQCLDQQTEKINKIPILQPTCVRNKTMLKQLTNLQERHSWITPLCNVTTIMTDQEFWYFESLSRYNSLPFRQNLTKLCIYHE